MTRALLILSLLAATGCIRVHCRFDEGNKSIV